MVTSSKEQTMWARGLVKLWNVIQCSPETGGQSPIEGNLKPYVWDNLNLRTLFSLGKSLIYKMSAWGWEPKV